MSPQSVASLNPGRGYGGDDTPYVIVPNHNGKSSSELIEEILPLPQKYIQDAVLVPNTEKPGFSGIYRSKAYPNGTKYSAAADLNTYHTYFDAASKRYSSLPCLAYRKYDYIKKVSEPEYTTISYGEVSQLKKELGSGILYSLHNSPYKDSAKYECHAKIDNHRANFRSYNKDNYSFILSIFSSNRWEWVLTDLMCSSYSITNTALYDTLGPKTSEYILELTQSPIIVASKNHVKNLIELKNKNPEALGHVISIVSIDPLLPGDSFLVNFAHQNKISLFDFDQIIKLGRIFPTEELPPHTETLFTISFTSGTTGANPKGVMLLQRTAAAAITCFLTQVEHKVGWKSFCFLPLAHIFERQTTGYSLAYGACIGFPQHGGSPLTLIEDLRLWKPNIMSNVPRVFTKLEAAIKNATIDSDSKLKRSIFGKIFEYKMEAQSKHDGANGAHFVYDTVFLSKLRSSLGFDNMNVVITGSAPISANSVKFLRAALNVGFSQGYGMTETYGGFVVSIPFEATPGSCGGCGMTMEMRLRELPGMGYSANDEGGPRGELLLRGPQIFPGYFRNEEETNKSFDEDGWFYTGDVARVNSENGRLYIVDRVKNFFKLAQGEYVTPEKVENLYLSSNPIMTQCYTHGDSLKHYLVGVVGLDQQLIAQFLVEKCKIDASYLQTPEDILRHCNRVDVRKQILVYLNSNIQSKLQGFEKLHNIYIEFEPLRVDRDVVTPTMKLKRAIASKYFGDQIDQMYEEGSLIKNDKL